MTLFGGSMKGCYDWACVRVCMIGGVCVRAHGGKVMEGKVATSYSAPASGILLILF